MIYLVNAFSLNMLEVEPIATMRVEKIDLNLAKMVFLAEGFQSAVGHESTAKILTQMLGIEIPCNRMTVKLQPGDTAIVAQYIGPRLPEGATELPPEAKIEFFRVFVW